MRALRVVGLDADGKAVICEDPERGDRFLIPADERLRVAASGDITRLGQMATDVESPMRPREIQARIRAGESVDQVAAVAGLPANRVERFAYPVLLERARAAELAQRAHPVREDGPDVQTLGEVIAHAFGLRGHDYSATSWDAWRGEDGRWVVQLLWRAGRSDNRAHWVYHPGAQGGTVTALDEHAVDLMDPSPSRPLRTVRPVTQLALQALEVAPDTNARATEIVEPAAAAAGHNTPVHTTPVHNTPVHNTPGHPAQAHSGAYGPPPAPNPPARPAAPQEQPPAAAHTGGQAPAAPPPPAEQAQAPEPTRSEEPARVTEPAPELFEPQHEPASEELVPEPAAVKSEAPAASRKAGQSSRKGRKNHPIVPSWEDVLLGVRTPRE